ncbi:uncharacterized protein [Dermacentor albipictus]|uniref:uncharacterized protein isoform X2 n=1 Tax=Dermacentor albipictus TaxID=60249 RepID=UPI0031FC13E7
MKNATKESSTSDVLGAATAPSVSSGVRKNQSSSTKPRYVATSSSVASPNEVRSSQMVEQRVLEGSEHEHPVLANDPSRVTVPQTICHLTDSEPLRAANITPLESNANAPTTATASGNSARDAFSSRASNDKNLRPRSQERHAPSEAPPFAIKSRASSEPLLNADKSRHDRPCGKASSAGSVRVKQPSPATSAANASVGDRTWTLASQARTFIRSREPSPVRRSTAVLETSKRSCSFSLDTERIIELQNMTNEAAIRDMIRRIEHSMTLPVSRVEAAESTTTTTITLPVEPPKNTSTFEETLSQATKVTTTDTGTRVTSTDTSRTTRRKKDMKVRAPASGLRVTSGFTSESTQARSETSNSMSRTTGHSTNATTSSKAESSSSTGETETGWRTLYLLCQIVPLAALVFLLLAIVILLPRLNRTQGSLARSGLELRDWSSVCDNPTCDRALASLMEPMDTNVSPCDDLYRHMCGRWRAVNPRRRSYAAENHHNFLVTIHRRLSGLSLDSGRSGTDVPPARGGCDLRTRMIAVFYASCLRFGRRPSMPSLQAALSGIGIDAAAWLSSRNSQELLARVVAACLRSGVASVIRVRRSPDGHSIFIEVGETLKHSLANGEDEDGDDVATGRPRWFVEKALQELQLDVHWSKVAELDGFVDSTRRKLGGGLLSEPFRNVQDQQLPRKLAELHWHTFLEPDLRNQTFFDSSGGPRNLSFYVRGLIEVGEVIRALGDSTEPDVANLYTLLVPAAQLFAYVRPWLVPRKNREDRVIPACLRATERCFASEFSSLVAAWTESARARMYFGDMVSALRSALTISVPDQDNLAVNGTHAHVPFKVDTIPERRKSEFACRKESLSPPFLSTDDFVGNVVLMFKEDRFINAEPPRAVVAEVTKDGTFQLHSSLGFSLWASEHTVFVPPLYLSGDLLHAEASEPSLNVPTVGVPVLISWARSVIARRDHWSATAASYGNCVRKNHPLDHALSDRASDEVLLTNALLAPWAVRVALNATAVMARKVRGASGHREASSLSSNSTVVPRDSNDKARTQVFFGRLCLMKCGDPIGASACSYATVHSPEFAEAFGCPKHREPSEHHPCTDILSSLAATLASISSIPSNDSLT